MTAIPGTYLPENLASYNFIVSAIIGLIFVVVVVALVLGSKSSRARKRPE